MVYKFKTNLCSVLTYLCSILPLGIYYTNFLYHQMTKTNFKKRSFILVYYIYNCHVKKTFF